MAEIINQSEQVERVRKAVLQLGCDVTVGDVMSITGLGSEEAKAGLDALIQTHEGTMRVSEKGELLYSFAGGCILRDQRSWWERNKKAIMKFVKGLFKVIIMLVLVVYFVIFMLILIALLCSNRDDRGSSSFNFSGIWFIFWGSGSSNPYYSGNKYAKAPLYTRVYNFVFGPEEEELDPLAARSKCAQLIRAKRGVITVEDWIMISGQTREKCESDLARYTAEFNGSAEITDNGTLIYVFEEMMGSTKLVKKEALPAAAWTELEKPKPLSGNTPENGGNGAVIGLNTFNMIMSFVIMYALKSVIGASVDTTGMTPEEIEMLEQGTNTLNQYAFWLGIFPFIFSSLIFLGPLVRLPGNRRENRERRARSVRKAVLQSVFDKPEGAKTSLNSSIVLKNVNNCLNRNCLMIADESEVQTALNEIVCELGGETDFDTHALVFENMDTRLEDARLERNKLALDEKALGRVVYSTDNREQERINDENEQAEMEDFDRLLSGEGSKSTPGRSNVIDSGNIMDGLKNIGDSDYDSGYRGHSGNHSSWGNSSRY